MFSLGGQQVTAATHIGQQEVLGGRPGGYARYGGSECGRGYGGYGGGSLGDYEEDASRGYGGGAGGDAYGAYGDNGYSGNFDSRVSGPYGSGGASSNNSSIINNTNNINNNGNCSSASAKRLLNGFGLNLSTQLVGSDAGIELSPGCGSIKRKKEFSPLSYDEDCCQQPYSENLDIHHQMEPPWVDDFSGVMRQVYGPVTAVKTIYEDDKGYLIMRVRVSRHFHSRGGKLRYASRVQGEDSVDALGAERVGWAQYSFYCISNEVENDLGEDRRLEFDGGHGPH